MKCNNEDFGLSAINYLHAEKRKQIEDMQSYIENLKTMDPDKAKEKSFHSLLNSGIIDEKGNLIHHN